MPANICCVDLVDMTDPASVTLYDMITFSALPRRGLSARGAPERSSDPVGVEVCCSSDTPVQHGTFLGIAFCSLLGYD
jgi:hypothetical protein